MRRVVAHQRGDDLALRQRRAVVHRHDADQVVRALDDDRLEAVALGDQRAHAAEQIVVGLAQRQEVEVAVGEDGELREVDRVGALAQDLPLRAALAALAEEALGVAEVVRDGVRGQRLRGRQRPAVAREDVADLALGDRHQRHDVDAVLEREEHVPAAAQHVGLEAGLALERDEAALHRPVPGDQLLDDADPVVGDVADEA